MTLTRHGDVVFHEEQADATAKLLMKEHPSLSFEEAKKAVVDLISHDMTEDTYWRQGLSFVFIVYSGNHLPKFAEICIDALKMP